MSFIAPPATIEPVEERIETLQATVNADFTVFRFPSHSSLDRVG
ncbi:hypothetical protein [Candidatus Methylomirabilis sp.]|nr:hypothetical protein [Candidatus Methylomirabilis sp.]